MSSPRLFPQDRRSGFALLITVTLLAFLVLLLVSLASLTRVETQVASNNQQLAQARQNALMALNVALGHLQAAAGPDQRVTATAELDATAAPANRHWTGVWDSGAGSATYGQRLAWLVSGPAPDAGTAVADPGSTGVSATSVRLVGANSADLGTPAASDANRVDVPLEEIRAATVPGLDPVDGGHVVGHFGWWVGDEGVKAKVSLADPWAASTDPGEKARRLHLAQRSGIELVDSSTAYSPTPPANPGTPLADAYPVNDAADLAKMVSLKQLPLANPAGQAALADAVKYRFHDLTATSCSVLADVARGGLKKDLTAWLAHPSGLPADAPLDSDPLFARAGGDSSGFGIPKWGIIRSYASLQGSPTAPLPSQVQTDSQQGFGPVLTYFRLGFAAHSSALPKQADGITDDPGGNTHLVAQAFPLLVLWNPYTTPIAAGSYELVIGFRFGNQAVQFALVSGSTATVKGRLTLTTTPKLLAGSDPVNDGGNAKRRFMRFAVHSPQIAPGQSLVFTPEASGEYQAPGDPAAIALVVNGGVNGLPATDRSIYFSNPDITLTPADRTHAIRVSIPSPFIQFGLYPAQPAGRDPTVADMVEDMANQAHRPYLLMGNIRSGPGAPGTSAAPMPVAPQVPTEPKAYIFGRVQMSKNPTNTYFYTNVRWLAQLSPRAPYHLWVPPGDNVGGSLSMIAENYAGTAAPVDKFDGNQASAGPSIDAFPPSIPTTNLQIAEIVPASAQPESRFFSLAQLQHANFSFFGQTAGSAVGNSQVNFVIGQTLTGVASAPKTDLPETLPATNGQWYYDLSYLLNQTLWDRYFFSTIPSTGTTPLTDAQIAAPAYHLPNARHVFYDDPASGPPTASDLVAPAAFDTAAAHLLLNGGFNVNSASEQAWRALLASHNNVDTAPGGFAHPYARFSSTAVGDAANTSWSSSYRILSDAQIRALAQAIVAEVKTRGPFLSLADFVNRRLRADATGLKGPLQAAIDATDLEISASKRINDRSPFNDTAYNVGPKAFYNSQTPTLLQKQLFLADEAADVARPSSSRAAFAPGFLTQADLLNALGPVLTARSDTFVIRAYGDAQSPVTQAIEGRAWCEAVVQRLPDYVQAGVNSWDTPAAGSDSEKFGRRFRIVSFRWLSAGDI